MDPFVLPVDGKPTSNFGTRSYYNGQQRAPHAGIDFVGTPGTPIRAANRGETSWLLRCTSPETPSWSTTVSGCFGLRAFVGASREGWQQSRADDDCRPGRCDGPRHRTTPSLERSPERRARRSALTCRRYRNGNSGRPTVDVKTHVPGSVLLPLYDNEGHAFEQADYVQLRSELADHSAASPHT